MGQTEFFDLGHLRALPDAITNSPPWHFLVAIVGIVGIIWLILKPIWLSAGWVFRRVRGAKLASLLAAETRVASFTEDEIADAVQHYVVPDASSMDPANEEDMRHFAAVREDVFTALNRAFQSTEKAHVMILADSGMGKTTLLLNLYALEQVKRKSIRRKMAVVPLGRHDADDQIKAIDDKRNTILLLDALDEDTLAIEDHEQRLRTLMNLAADFRHVLISCRTQFFESDQAVPMSTGVARVGPKRAGVPGAHSFQRVFLAPFTEGQVEAYIRRIIPIYKPFARRKARAIVSRIPELSVRPMLLTLLPQLISNDQEFGEIWDLFEFMVQSWLKRESHWIDPADLLRASERIAVDVYLQRETRHSERLSPDSIVALLEGAISPIETWKLTARSLLNRDAVGNFKFAHRSIMEFLFIRALVGGDDRCTRTPWTDMMCTLFLSWGRSRSGSEKTAQMRAEYLLKVDRLFETGLFPLIETAAMTMHTINEQSAKRALGMANQMRDRLGIPPSWRKWTSDVIRQENPPQVRVYEFAEAAIWQFLDTTRQMADKNIYLDSPWDRQYRDQYGNTWDRPTLTEFRSLADALLSHGDFLLDSEVLYWLLDADGQFYTMARLRDTRIENEPKAEYLRKVMLLMTLPVGADGRFSLDVYSVRKIFSQDKIGLGIRVLRADASSLWAEDRANNCNWIMNSVSYSGDAPPTLSSGAVKSPGSL